MSKQTLEDMIEIVNDHIDKQQPQKPIEYVFCDEETKLKIEKIRDGFINGAVSVKMTGFFKL